MERTYKAYISNCPGFGDIEIEYSANEVECRNSVEQHKDARMKALTLERKLDGELICWYVRRENEWNLVAAKTK